MRRRFTIGLVLAVFFTLGNVAGALWAAAMGERPHTMLHVVLAVAGALATTHLLARRRMSIRAVEREASAPRELGKRLNDLEQSLDAIALEVERVGEGQRYMTQLFVDGGEGGEQPR